MSTDKYNPLSPQNSTPERGSVYILNVDDVARSLPSPSFQALVEAVTEITWRMYRDGVDVLVCRDSSDPRNTGRWTVSEAWTVHL